MIDTMQGYVAPSSPLMIEAHSRRLAKQFVAYIAATAWHEPGHKMEPVRESLNYSEAALKKKRKYFTAAEANALGRNKDHPADQEAIANKMYANRIGNGDESSGDGWRYRGRGYVQLTGRENYERFGYRLNIDLVSKPEMACDPDIAMKILFEGMMDGVFTGRSLRQYIKPSAGLRDYVNARRVVNGTDKADLIAGYAGQFEALLANYNPTAESRTIAEAKATKKKAGAGAVIGLAGTAMAAGDAVLGDTSTITGAAALGAQLGEYMPYLMPVFIFSFAGLFVWINFRANKIEALRKADAEAGA